MITDIISTDARDSDLQIIQAVSPFTMTPPERVLATIKSVEYLVKHNIPGDIVECGVWRGGNMLAATLKLIELGAPPRHIYLYDTFEGMSEPTEKDVHPDGSLASDLLQNNTKDKQNHIWAFSPLEDVKRLFESANYPQEYLHFVKGKVEDTIPATVPGQIGLLRLDTDWYESTKHELLHLYPLLVEQGVLIIDDYGFWKGSRTAVDEYWETLSLKPELHVVNDSVDSSSRWCLKPQGSTAVAPTAVVKNDPTTDIEGDEYLRHRLKPRAGDPLYVHLVDLLEAMQSVQSNEHFKLLDYGCGGSPYKTLFPNTDYKRADLAGVEDLDYVIGNDSKVQEADNTFDMVLSNQVLEHTPEPQSYIKECFRLLKPGGTLVLSVPSIYEEHACPHDYHRWTFDGLQYDLKKEGFVIERIDKLTCGARAVLFLLEHHLHRWPDMPRDAFGIALHNVLKIMNDQKGYTQQWSDQVFDGFKMTDSREATHNLYLGLFVVAKKPQSA